MAGDRGADEKEVEGERIAGEAGGARSTDERNEPLAAEASSNTGSRGIGERPSASEEGEANSAGSIAPAGADSVGVGPVRLLEGTGGLSRRQQQARRREEESDDVLRQLEALKHAMKNLAGDVSAAHTRAVRLHAEPQLNQWPSQFLFQVW